MTQEKLSSNQEIIAHCHECNKPITYNDFLRRIAKIVFSDPDGKPAIFGCRKKCRKQIRIKKESCD